jgi:hypothetical protein
MADCNRGQPTVARQSEVTQKPIDELRPFLERVQILGPTMVERAASDLNSRLTVLQQWMLQRLSRGSEPGSSWGDIYRVMPGTDQQRQMFVAAARGVMQAAPKPDAE